MRSERETGCLASFDPESISHPNKRKREKK
jgi:hypothetical protein